MHLLLIAMWIYGRQRFQRDIHFMLNVVLPRTLVVLIRFVTPVLILIIGVSYDNSFIELQYDSTLFSGSRLHGALSL